jgi:hypothetical protein
MFVDLKKFNLKTSSDLIKVGLGLGEDACIAFALFNLCLLGCQSLRETILQNPDTLLNSLKILILALARV